MELARVYASEHAEKAQEDYANRCNLRARFKEFKPGDQVIILMPDLTQKLYSRWIGPAIFKERVAYDKDSNIIVMKDCSCSKHKLHANKLHLFQNGINSFSVIFDTDSEFGNVVACPQFKIQIRMLYNHYLTCLT